MNLTEEKLKLKLFNVLKESGIEDTLNEHHHKATQNSFDYRIREAAPSFDSFDTMKADGWLWISGLSGIEVKLQIQVSSHRTEPRDEPQLRIGTRIEDIDYTVVVKSSAGTSTAVHEFTTAEDAAELVRDIVQSNASKEGVQESSLANQLADGGLDKHFVRPTRRPYNTPIYRDRPDSSRMRRIRRVSERRRSFEMGRAGKADEILTSWPRGRDINPPEGPSMTAAEEQPEKNTDGNTDPWGEDVPTYCGWYWHYSPEEDVVAMVYLDTSQQPTLGVRPLSVLTRIHKDGRIETGGLDKLATEMGGKWAHVCPPDKPSGV